MTDLLNTKNTLNITFNYDKTNQKTGYFTLDLRQDNKTYVPKQLDTKSVTYYKEGGYEIKTWPAKLVNGKIVLQATDFPDLRQAGTYVIRATVDNIIFPSQGKCTLTLNGDFSADTPVETQIISGHDGADGASVTSVNVDENGLMTVTLDNGKSFTSQIKMPEAVKGERGDKGNDGLSAYQLAQQAGFKGSLEEWLQSLKAKDGLAGKNAAEITNASIVGKTLTFTLSDNSSYSVELPLLKGDRGEAGLAGKDAPTIINASIDGNTLTFDLSDGTKHSVILPLLKGDRGEAGQAGKDAPKITGVTLNGNALKFDLSDSSTYSVNLPLLKGDTGKTGQTGKDAPKITNITLNDNNLTFTLSDNSSYSIILPLLKGDRGEKGENGLSAYQLAQQAGFKGSLEEWLQSLKGAKGDTGLPGKDAPKITGVTLNDDQTQIIFNMSDGTQIKSNFKAPTAIPGKDGKDAPKITNVTLKENTLTFDLSDSTSYAVTLPLLKGDKGDQGQSGKDAPKITKASFTDGTLTFTLSDNSTISTPLELSTDNVKDEDQLYSTTSYANLFEAVDKQHNPTIINRQTPILREWTGMLNLNLKYKKGEESSLSWDAFKPNGVSFKSIFDEIDTKLDKSVNDKNVTESSTTITSNGVQLSGEATNIPLTINQSTTLANGTSSQKTTNVNIPIDSTQLKETMFVTNSDPNFKKINWHITSVSANSDNFSQVTRLFFSLSPTVVYTDPKTGKAFAQPKIAIPSSTYPQETIGTIIDSSTFEIIYQIWDLDSMPINPQPTFFDPSAYSTAKSGDLIFFGNRQMVLSCPIDPSKIPSDKQELFKLIKPQPFDTSVNLYLHFK